MSKMKLKLTIDVIMTLLIITLFSKTLFGMQYHEIAGLIFVIIALVHNIINFKTTCALYKEFSKIPTYTKINFIVDILLILAFAYLGFGGALIAHTLPTGVMSQNMFMKISHIFIGYLTIALLGVHIGLHIFRRKIATKIVVALTVVAIILGGYGFINSGISKVISMPIAIISGESFNGGNYPKSEEPTEREQFQLDKGATEQRSFEGKGGSGERRNQNYSNGENVNASAGRGQPMPNMTASKKIENILMYAGILLFFTMLTYWIAVDKKRFKSK